MKKYIYCVLIALIAISCNKDEYDDPSIETPIVIPQTLFGQTPIFESRAVFDDQPVSWDDSETVDSRTYAVIDGDSATYTQYWSENDAISLFLTTANLQYEMKNYIDETKDIGKFELVGSPSQGSKLSSDYYYSVYPYKNDTKISRKGTITFTFPETQHYRGDTYANGENGMIAIIPEEEWNENGSNTLYFKNFCSYLQLRLTSSKGNVVKKIILKSNDGNAIAGEGDIDVEDDIPYVEMDEDASNTITLDCGTGVTLSETPTNFWFVLPAIYNDDFIGHEFLDGFEITVIFKNGPSYKRTTQNPISIKRNHIKRMADLKTDIETNLLGTIIYKYKDPVTNTDSLNFINHEGDINFADADGNLLHYEQTYNEETQEWYVTFPDGDLMNIGNNVFDFNRTEDLDYIIVNNKAGINIKDHAFYNCTAESIEFYNNVNKVEHDAFGASDIKNVQFNGNVTTIGEFAFLGSKVENVEIKGSVQTVEGSAFIQCHNLKTATLNGVQNIGEYAFKYCENLSSIEIVTNDNTVLTMGEGVFADCTSLTTVTLNAKIPPIFIHDNSESDGPYIFPSNTQIYVPTITDYQNESYDYPGDESRKNWWPRYYSNQLRAM